MGKAVERAIFDLRYMDSTDVHKAKLNALTAVTIVVMMGLCFLMGAI